MFCLTADFNFKWKNGRFSCKIKKIILKFCIGKDLSADLWCGECFATASRKYIWMD